MVGSFSLHPIAAVDIRSPSARQTLSCRRDTSGGKERGAVFTAPDTCEPFISLFH